MRFLVIAGYVVLFVAVLIGVVALIGSRLPKDHVVTRSVVVRQPPRAVYDVARDFAAAPTWRSDLKRVEMSSGPAGQVRFREEARHGTVNYELTEDVPGSRMVTRILDTGLGYSGRWTYVFETAGDGTRVTITEHGEVSNLIFRFMSRYVFGQASTIDGYLAALSKRLGG